MLLLNLAKDALKKVGDTDCIDWNFGINGCEREFSTIGLIPENKEHSVIRRRAICGAISRQLLTGEDIVVIF